MTQSTSTEVRGAIAAANENFIAAFKRGAAAGMAALYTENGQVMPPNGDFVTGKQAVQMFWQALMDMGIKEAKLEIIEVEGHGDTAIVVSTFTLQGEGGRCWTRASTSSFGTKRKGNGSCTVTSSTAVCLHLSSDTMQQLDIVPRWGRARSN